MCARGPPAALPGTSDWQEGRRWSEKLWWKELTLGTNPGSGTGVWPAAAVA